MAVFNDSLLHHSLGLYRDEKETYLEGAMKRVIVNAYERNAAARQACIDHYGTSCFACGLDLEKKYGQIGKGYIHVHYLTPLSDISVEYELDPIRDLRPVCPNCHAMIHRRTPPYSVAEIQTLIIEKQP